MEIGTLNQRITFLVNRVVTDEIGNHTAVWDEAFSCWAKVTLKASAEHTDAGVTKETQTLEFLIQTFPDLRVLLLIRSKPDQFLPDRQRDILDRATDIFVINVIFFLNG